MAKTYGLWELAQTSESRWKIYLYTMVAVTAFTSVAFLFPALMTVFFFPVLIAGIIAYVLFLMLIRQADQSFRI
ncbi:hypothetical protein [Effusibacillus lacus]|uniref:Uncharacterized protein n=1 Tax=Effusibacillus lacus TaxID=1348429 RepID=A0A292YG02_9BACL|nr:hypothetical protein [Effusibacillus lacus]TCS72838.1 hypothetical protein EDD64_12053 [Effusibacillus lacus]GAX89237.1 hypothetical protein EFBL_0855 [Effusibacillus lacus]